MKKRKRWTKSEVESLAKNYSNPNQFRNEHGGAYMFAHKNKMIYDLFPVDKRIVVPYTQEQVGELASKCKTLYQFRKTYPSAYAVIKRKRWGHLLAHLPPSVKLKWEAEEILSLAKQYKSYSDFYKNNSGAYSAAQNMGILDKLRSFFYEDGKRPPRKVRENLFAQKTSNEQISEVAKNYSSVKEFKEDHPSLFKILQSRKIVTKILGHLKRDYNHKKGPSTTHKNRFWKEENIAAEALKYKSRVEFYRGSMGAYGAAKRLGILKKVCTHMVYKKSGSIEQSVILDYVTSLGLQAIYNYRDSRDEIDVFVPSLQKGIEFDGDYWHRNKKDKDAEKEARFLSKGVQILRIKESDWHKNREENLIKICDFFGVAYVKNDHFLQASVCPQQVEIHYTKEDLINMAKPFKTKSDIMKNPEYYWLFKALYRRGLWKEATAHMPERKKRPSGLIYRNKTKPSKDSL